MVGILEKTRLLSSLIKRYLLSSPANAERLRTAISKIASGDDWGTSLRIEAHHDPTAHPTFKQDTY